MLKVMELGTEVILDEGMETLRETELGLQQRWKLEMP